MELEMNELVMNSFFGLSILKGKLDRCNKQYSLNDKQECSHLPNLQES